MPTVQDLLDRKGQQVVSIAIEDSVLDAAKLMNEHHIGAVVVSTDSKVVGIFTERDILNRVVAAGRDPATTLVKDVMTSPVAVCAPRTTRDECRAVMRGKRIRHLPVVQDEKLMGIVSIGDILLEAEADHEDTIRYLYEYMMGEWPQPAGPA